MPPKCYRLLDTERAYLEEGTATGSYRDHELKERATEKVELLSDRFEHLFVDTELLERRFQEESNLLATEEGFQAWCRLMGLEGATRGEVEEALSFGRSQRGSAPADFGAELGKTVDRLMRWPEFGDVTEEDIVADLVWGFLRGLQFDRRVAGEVTGARVQDDTDEIIGRVAERVDTFTESLDTDSTPGFLLRQRSRQNKRQEMTTRVQDLLVEDHSKDGEKLATEIAKRHEEDEDEVSDFARQVVGHIMDGAVDGDQTIGSFGQFQSFWDRYGPAEEFDTGEIVTESKVYSVIEERRLDEKHELKRELEREAEALADKGRKGIPAADVLPLIVEDGPLSSKEIATQVADSRNHAASVTRLAKDLAGDESGSTLDGPKIWTARPLLAGDPSGWETTEYGKAATHALERHLAQNETHPYGLDPREASPFPDELLSRALSEVTDVVVEPAAIDDE
jgi:hypothetical protein